MGLLQDALQGIGTVADTPRAMAWAALAGRNPLAAALNPDERIRGEDVTGDPYTGFGLEMLGDPLNLIGAAGLFSKLKGAKAAKKFNAMAEKLLASGGMPEDVARATKVIDEANNPLIVSHGTPEVFGKYDLAKADPNALYGKGLYHTDNPEVASGYAETKLASDSSNSNVRMRYMDARNPFDLSSQYPVRMGRLADALPGKVYREQEIQRLENDLSAYEKVRNRGEPSESWENLIRQTRARLSELNEPTKPGRRIVEDLMESGGSPRDILSQAGYDAIIHTGGGLTGGTPHRVWIGFHPDQFYAPWIAPNKKPVPSANKLIAALAGYNLTASQR